MIDIGPGAGDEGGRIVAAGPPPRGSRAPPTAAQRRICHASWALPNRVPSRTHSRWRPAKHLAELLKVRKVFRSLGTLRGLWRDLQKDWELS